MTKAHKLSNKRNDAVKKHPVLRKVVTAAIVLAFLIGVFYAVLFVNNNVSFISDEVFAKQMTKLIKAGYIISFSTEAAKAKIAPGVYDCQKTY